MAKKKMGSQTDKVKQQIKLHEGVEYRVYEDTQGILTIGVGRNLEDRGLSEDEVYYFLNNDIKICVKELRWSFDWYYDLDDIRKRVLVDMMFNLGMPRLKGCVKMLEAIESGAWGAAAEEMLDSTWARQVGSRADRLSEMMETGTDYIG